MTWKTYQDFLQSVLDQKDFGSFKCNKTYNNVLEHVDEEKGQQYYNCIKNEFELSDETILDFCRKNDFLGNPNKVNYSFGLCSPTSLRYVYFAHLILSELKKLNKTSTSLVEIGGGYGGLCLAIYHYAPNFQIQINKYYLIDLPEAVLLQKKYLDIFQIPNIEIHNAETYGQDIQEDNLYCIATYSFSEIGGFYQNAYLCNLFPKVSHGFMVWNWEGSVNLDRDFASVVERPLTAEFNRFVYF